MTFILSVSENTLKISKNTCEKQMYSNLLCQSWPNVFNKYHFLPQKNKNKPIFLFNNFFGSIHLEISNAGLRQNKIRS